MPNFLNNIKRLRKNEKGVIPLIIAALGIVLLIIVIIIAIIAVIGFVGYFSGKEQPVEASAGGCYLVDSVFTETTTITSTDDVTNKLATKWPQIKDKKSYLEKIITESKNANINPAVLIAIWCGEQTFGNPDAAFGCGIYPGSPNRNVGFDKQLQCAIPLIKKAINNTSPYNQPAGENIFTRLFYNYTGAMQAFYKERGYVADESNPRVQVLQILVPNDVVCFQGSVSGNVPLFKQCDPKWATNDFGCGGTTICNAGCGPTSLAMVLSYYGKKVTPDKAASEVLANGWRLCNSGTSWSAMTGLPQKYGLKSTEVEWTQAKTGLLNKKPVIVSWNAHTRFTNGGHYCVLTGYNTSTNEASMNDPGGKNITSAREDEITNPSICGHLWLIEQ